MNHPRLPRTRRGQSMIDYLVACAALAFALFVPLRDAASPDEPRTAAGIVLHAFQTAYDRFSYAMSLPV